jgi:hypothetical protein
MTTNIKTFAVTLLSALFTLCHGADLESNLREHIRYLADDKREGRGIGTAGLEQAAVYIEEQWKTLGLAPAFAGSYRQPFEMGWGVHLGPGNLVRRGELTADTASGMMPIGFASAGSVSAPVIFAGYGIVAPEFNYDDYAGIDAKGAIILCMTGEPGEFDSTSAFEGVNYTAHATSRSKAGNAKLKGAVALILVEGPLYAGTAAEQLDVPRADEPYMDCGLPAIRLTREAVKKLFPEFELDKLQRSIDSNTQPRSMSISDTTDLALTVDLTRQSVTVENVGGIIPGGDSMIVIGAHYDHLGFGQSGTLESRAGLIHNGADDNASGVSAIIEVARLLKANPVKETVLVVAFTAEETGLGGSSHLVKHMPARIDLVRAMLNLDMVGRVRENKLTVLGCNTATEFNGIVSDANKSAGLEIVCKGDGYGPSDHMSFYTADRPVLFLFSGAHEDYHKSTDDENLINYDGVVKTVQLTEQIVRGISSYSGALSFVKSTEPPPQGGGRFRAWFGSIPDYSQADSLIGVLLQGVRATSPAESAGLKGGDLLTKMGKVTINNIYDFVFALRTYAPGDSVQVSYVRGGSNLMTTAILGSPPK